MENLPRLWVIKWDANVTGHGAGPRQTECSLRFCRGGKSEKLRETSEKSGAISTNSR